MKVEELELKLSDSCRSMLVQYLFVLKPVSVQISHTELDLIGTHSLDVLFDLKELGI